MQKKMTKSKITSSNLRTLILLHPEWNWTKKAFEEAFEMPIEKAIKKGYITKI